VRHRDVQLLLVILGLASSTALLSNPPEVWSALLSLLTLAATLIALSALVRSRSMRSRSLLLSGGAVLLAGTLWLGFVLASIESPLRWLLAFALAWMVALFFAYALTNLAERLAIR
jgi:hypothetical protein